jgi:hypothetical protein
MKVMSGTLPLQNNNTFPGQINIVVNGMVLRRGENFK